MAEAYSCYDVQRAPVSEQGAIELAVTRELPTFMRLAEAAQEVVQLGNRIVHQSSQNGSVDPDLIRWYESAKGEVAGLEIAVRTLES